MAIHDIEMERIYAGLFRSLDFFAEAGKIRSQ
jgi:hypothetical protein